MFTEQYTSYLTELDATLRDVVHSFANVPKEFQTMIEYPMGWVDENGDVYPGETGKRVRPILLLSCVVAGGGDWRDGLYVAAAVEILHNFSLVHDDIQDDSPIRHKRQTVWKVWGTPMAINVGDAMFALAYRALEMLNQTQINAETRLVIQEVFNRTILDLTRGQYLDMSFETRKKVSVDDYLSMVGGKTAALLAGTAQMGALIAGVPPDVSEGYANFGHDVGIAFQIRDDILGIWGDAELTGKSVATDIAAKKKSVPILYGLERSETLREIYAKPVLREEDVSYAVTQLEQVGAKDYALSLEQKYYTAAMQSLDNANPQKEGRAQLIALVEGLFKRSY